MGPDCLFHTYCFNGAGVNADSAVNAELGIYLRLAANHFYGFTRALRYAGFATGALLLIHFSRHSYRPFKNNKVTNGKTECYKIILLLQHKFLSNLNGTKIVFTLLPDRTYILENTVR